MENEIPSPYLSTGKVKPVTIEMLKKVSEMSGTNSVFIVIGNNDVGHVCTPSTCTGHYMNYSTLGFTPQQLVGIAALIAEDHGYKVVRKAEDDRNEDAI